MTDFILAGDPTIDPLESVILATLEQILKKESLTHVENAYYCGGTLCLDYDDDVHFLNFRDAELSKDVKYLMAKIYVEYKSPQAAFYEVAKEIIKDFENHSNHPWGQIFSDLDS